MDKKSSFRIKTESKTSTATTARPRKIEQRSVSFGGHSSISNVKTEKDSSQKHPPRRHSETSSAPYSTKSAKTTLPNPLPTWIVEKNKKEEQIRGDQERYRAATMEKQKRNFKRSNSLGWEGRNRHRHPHQAKRQLEYEAYISGVRIEEDNPHAWICE